MRPLTLRINGLRSYLSEQEIDFTDVDLMAIIGDTGAGKSSLLEALCVALYGCCTWDARGAKPLIADGAITLRVELTFGVAEKTWRVTRAISRGPYPPAIHLLECLDDGRRIDNGDPVNAAIRKLIGLDFATFLKAVLLPQGRFQILLQMSNTDRTPILRSILGLDQLTTVREAALELAGRLRPQLAALRERRAALLPDPEAARDAARRRFEEAQAAVTRVDAVKKRIGKAREVQSQANVRAGEAKSSADALEAASVDAIPAYERLIAVDAEVSEAADRAQEELSRLEDQEHQLEAVLEDTNRSRVGVAHLATAHATLTGLISEMPELEAENGHCKAEAKAIEAGRRELASREEAVDTLQEQARKAEDAVTAAEATAQRAEDSLDAARKALAEARVATKAAEDATAKVQEAATLVERREKESAEARRVAQVAETAYVAAAEHLEAVRRSAASAHAASASQAGDPCPICKRVLPDGFVAPEPPGEADAQNACSAAEEEAKSTAKLATAAVTNAENACVALDTAKSASKESEKRRIEALERATELLGATDLQHSDDELLADVHALAEATATAVTDARQQARGTRDEATATRTELRAAGEGLVEREKALAATQTKLGRRRLKLGEMAAGLPDDFRVVEPWTIDTLSEALALVERRQAELAGTAEQLSATRQQLTEGRAKLKEIGSRRNSEIDVPSDRLRRGIERQADRAAEAAALLEEPGPVEPRDGSLTAQAEWARAIVTMAGGLIERLRVRARTESDAAAAAAGEISTAFASVGVEDDYELEELVVRASTDVRIATGDLETAEQHAPLAADLDGRIDAGGPFIDTLDELARLLADGKFVGAVVKRKQRALLGVGSELLSDMTAQRFGFAEGFQIVDRLSGQPRDVKTLSGGETFLASLALALALVELAGRGGGRVEALFLDEGFGSLDANSLTEALDALGRQAQGGRLVAVISHLHAVAENIDHVLLVTKGRAGSQVRWAKDLEREELVADELKTALLT